MRESVAMAEDLPPGAISVARPRRSSRPASRHTIRIRDYAPTSLERNAALRPRDWVFFSTAAVFVIGDLSTLTIPFAALGARGKTCAACSRSIIGSRPNNPFPAPRSTIVWRHTSSSAQSAVEFGIDPTRIVVGRRQAPGGNLSAVVSLKMRGGAPGAPR